MDRNEEGPQLGVIEGAENTLLDQLITSIFLLDRKKVDQLSEKINAPAEQARKKLRLAYVSEELSE